jgi:chemotaxis protein MotB
MFWLKRLKSGEEDVHWSVPYGDLMTLLLAVFVMIAAMSELKAGPQYNRMAGGVRQAFGFRAKTPRAAAIPTARPMTLLERIEQVAKADAGAARLDVGSDETTAPCEIAREGDRLVLRVPTVASFEPFSGAMKPETDRLLARLADYIAAGRGTVDVRGYAEDGMIPAGAPFRDAWDLSYQRARAAADVIARCGVSRDRLCVIAMGNRKASAGSADAVAAPKPTTLPAASVGTAGPLQANQPLASAPLKAGGAISSLSPSSVGGVSLEIVVRAAAAHAK